MSEKPTARGEGSSRVIDLPTPQSPYLHLNHSRRTEKKRSPFPNISRTRDILVGSCRKAAKMSHGPYDRNGLNVLQEFRILKKGEGRSIFIKVSSAYEEGSKTRRTQILHHRWASSTTTPDPPSPDDLSPRNSTRGEVEVDKSLISKTTRLRSGQAEIAGSDGRSSDQISSCPPWSVVA